MGTHWILKCFMCGLWETAPWRLTAILSGTPAFLMNATLAHSGMQALREGLLFLKSLMDTWLTCVKARAAGEVEERRWVTWAMRHDDPFK